MVCYTILLVGCDVGGEKRDVVVRENLIYEESMVLKRWMLVCGMVMICYVTKELAI